MKHCTLVLTAVVLGACSQRPSLLPMSFSAAPSSTGPSSTAHSVGAVAPSEGTAERAMMAGHLQGGQLQDGQFAADIVGSGSVPVEGAVGQGANDACGAVPCMEVVANEAKPMLPKPELHLTPEVRRAITHFTTRDRQFITKSLQEREKYYPEMVSIFREEGIPEELMNVGIIESKFRADAGSSAGAVGIWQFIKSTASMYGLRVGRGAADQRKDPILSTVAAARHLRDLYETWGDWLLALAAYNAGVGKVSRAVARLGDDADFWKIARSGLIRRETAQYVPRFIAVTLILSDPEKYGFDFATAQNSRTTNIG